MTTKLKIEKYVKGITKNPTYVDYLSRAVEFGFDLRNEEVLAKDKQIKELRKVVSAYEDMLKNDNVFNDDDY